MAIKFKKNDQVIVIAGSNKGKTGTILSIKDNRVLVEGVNLATVHKKPTSNQAGEIIKVAKPIHISNIAHIENGKPVKVGFKIETGTSKGTGKNFAGKIRVSKKSGQKIN
jgi:large subunit ribosomal protein L24